MTKIRSWPSDKNFYENPCEILFRKIHENVPELDVVSLFGLILAFSHSKVKISFAPGGFRLDILT